MGPRHLHMFLVYFMYVQDYLILDVFSLCLHFPIGSRGGMFSLNTIFILYQAIFKLVTE